MRIHVLVESPPWDNSRHGILLFSLIITRTSFFRTHTSFFFCICTSAWDSHTIYIRFPKVRVAERGGSQGKACHQQMGNEAEGKVRAKAMARAKRQRQGQTRTKGSHSITQSKEAAELTLTRWDLQS